MLFNLLTTQLPSWDISTDPVWNLVYCTTVLIQSSLIHRIDCYSQNTGSSIKYQDRLPIPKVLQELFFFPEVGNFVCPRGPRLPCIFGNFYYVNLTSYIRQLYYVINKLRFEVFRVGSGLPFRPPSISAHGDFFFPLFC